MASTTALTASNVVLEKPEQFHKWMLMIEGLVPRDLWKYFNPDTANNFDEPKPVTYDTIRPSAQSLTALNATERSQYTTLRAAYSFDMSQYQRFLSEEAKLRNKILSTVAEAKKTQLPTNRPVKTWLTNLYISTKPTDA